MYILLLEGLINMIILSFIYNLYGPYDEYISIVSE